MLVVVISVVVLVVATVVEAMSIKISLYVKEDFIKFERIISTF
jgi:hypothetical protein